MSLAADDPRPPYIQVADALRKDIAGGSLEPGQRLRSIRDLAQRFEVAQMTITNALRLLRDEGLIETTPNRGSFVARSQPIPTDDIGSLTQEVRSLREDVQRLSERLQALEIHD
ncbi:winged helix-turn-helix transcriptional regulator [Kineosporia sp. J2-2]|uniref:Winged helix-turn-helix transcriptional regulator n=1 Tax=Kineosporia corallincola TaxID=2835133 RepID=A0ABS5TJT0_9ACTN|nr:winged helix-turn-helix domain-containing protein [Kineosporia corallincola]MBT0771350.1 winged helix-turn-helix transcriptional regulator [Kineosporia corallincola]